MINTSTLFPRLLKFIIRVLLRLLSFVTKELLGARASTKAKSAKRANTQFSCTHQLHIKKHISVRCQTCCYEFLLPVCLIGLIWGRGRPQRVSTALNSLLNTRSRAREGQDSKLGESPTLKYGVTLTSE
jgi:hypothetical protein